MQASFFTRHPKIRDTTSFIVFVVCVIIGTIFINTFIFRSFNVEGPSMEQTLYTGDRLIVNRIPVTIAQLQNKAYVPDRGQIIVFKNPRYVALQGDEYIVKRVIAFPGERVTVRDGEMLVYNQEHPHGFNPDENFNGEPGSPTSGDADMIVADGTLFVAGDHREGSYSYDSRSGMGTIPYYNIVGPVSIRLFPFTAIRFF